MTQEEKDQHRNDSYVNDPRRLLFKEYYCNPLSPTFALVSKSAVRAGFGARYADQLKARRKKWYLDIITTVRMRGKAEKVLERFLDLDLGENKPENKIDPQMAKIKQDTAKFVAERLGKDKYSLRSEVTGAGGEKLPVLNTLEIILRKISEDKGTS